MLWYGIHHRAGWPLWGQNRKQSISDVSFCSVPKAAICAAVFHRGAVNWGYTASSPTRSAIAVAQETQRDDPGLSSSKSEEMAVQMNSRSLPLGAFTCPVTFKILRPPTFTRQEAGGVTYLIGRDYEFTYQTVLRFANDTEMPITTKLFGELNQQVVIRDVRDRPVQVSGYAQGRVEISDTEGNLVFEGHYYDSRIAQALTGDDALTLTGTRTVDHWENGFGRGAFAGHAFSLGVRLTREGNVPGSGTPGEASGRID
jgi:hypothetical protein